MTAPGFVLDFQNGAYSFNGAAINVLDVLVHNSDQGSFDPSRDLVAGVGLGNLDYQASPFFAGDLLEYTKRGAVYVFDIWADDSAAQPGDATAQGVVGVEQYTTDWADAARVWFTGDGVHLNDNFAPYEWTNGVHKGSARITPAGMSASRDGAANVVLPFAPALTDFVIGILTVDHGKTVRKLQVLPLDYDLPGLSTI